MLSTPSPLVPPLFLAPCSSPVSPRFPFSSPTACHVLPAVSFNCFQDQFCIFLFTIVVQRTREISQRIQHSLISFSLFTPSTEFCCIIWCRVWVLANRITSSLWVSKEKTCDGTPTHCLLCIPTLCTQQEHIVFYEGTPSPPRTMKQPYAKERNTASQKMC